MTPIPKFYSIKKINAYYLGSTHYLLGSSKGLGSLLQLCPMPHTACLLGSVWIHSNVRAVLVVVPQDWHASPRYWSLLLWQLHFHQEPLKGSVHGAKPQLFCMKSWAFNCHWGCTFTSGLSWCQASAALQGPFISLQNQNYLDGSYTTKFVCRLVHGTTSAAPGNTASVCWLAGSASQKIFFSDIGLLITANFSAPAN